MTAHSLRLAIVPNPSRTSFSGGDYWLRLEQITGSDIAAPAEMAEIVDELYGIEACSPEPTPEEELPPITWERLMEIAKRRLDIEECRQRASGDYTARVKVIYSHPGDPNHRPKLSVTIGTIVSQQIVQEEISLTLSVREQQSLSLDYPVLHEPGEEWPGTAKWIGSVFNEEAGPIPPPPITPAGNVLSWQTTATGTIQVKFATTYELATITVPGIPRIGSLKGDTQSTLLRAFWRLQVYELQVEAISQDTTADGQTLAQLCGWDSLTGGGSGDGDTSSGGSSDAGGDEGGSGEEQDDGLGCRDHDARLADPAFFEQKCCHPPNRHLDDCLVMAVGREIKPVDETGLRDRYANARGKVEFVAVGPGPDGCGISYHHQQVVPRSCCDDIFPLEADPTNTTTISPGQTVTLRVLGGDKSVLWRWTASSGLVFANGRNSIITSDLAIITAVTGLCHNNSVRVEDTCSILTMPLAYPGAPELKILEIDRILAPGATIAIELESPGEPPHSWSSDKLQSLGNGYFKAPDDFCGTATVYVSDACTQIDKAEVRSTAGEWVPIPGTSQICGGYSTKKGELASATQVETMFGKYYIISQGLYAGRLDPTGHWPCAPGNDAGSLLKICEGIWEGWLPASTSDGRCYNNRGEWLWLTEVINSVMEWKCAS